MVGMPLRAAVFVSCFILSISSEKREFFQTSIHYTMAYTQENITFEVECRRFAYFAEIFHLDFRRTLAHSGNEDVLAGLEIRPKSSVPTFKVLMKVPGVYYEVDTKIWKLKAIFTEGTCRDSGFYKCFYEYSWSIKLPHIFGPFITEYDRNISIHVLPGESRLSITPLRTSYSANTFVKMVCVSPLGSFTSGILDMVWESRDFNSTLWVDETADVIFEPPVLDPISECRVTQTGRLKRKLRLDDSRRTYRCYVRRTNWNGLTQHFYQNGSEIFIQDVRNPYIMYRNSSWGYHILLTWGRMAAIVLAVTLISLVLYILVNYGRGQKNSGMEERRRKSTKMTTISKVMEKEEDLVTQPDTPAVQLP